MANDTLIEWTDHTFNPWWGCTKVSPGCTHCYADRMATRWGHDIWGKGKERRRFGDKHWAEPLKWNRAAEAAGRPARVFCASMADVFEAGAPRSDRRRLWALIEATPSLRWQLLTKRPERILDQIPAAWRRKAPENVWYGTSVESRDFTWRVHELKRVPASVRFLSVEPMLGAIPRLPIAGVDWVIAGGESGPGARRMDIDWVRQVRDRCVGRGVPFFFKQWGGVNKKRTGRLLDGRTWDEFPLMELSENGKPQ